MPFLLSLLQIFSFCFNTVGYSIVPVFSFCTFSTLLLGRDKDNQRYESFTKNFYSGRIPLSLLSSIPFLTILSILSKMSTVPSMSKPLFSIVFSQTHTKYCSCLVLPCFETDKQAKTEQKICKSEG